MEFVLSRSLNPPALASYINTFTIHFVRYTRRLMKSFNHSQSGADTGQNVKNVHIKIRMGKCGVRDRDCDIVVGARKAGVSIS